MYVERRLLGEMRRVRTFKHIFLYFLTADVREEAAAGGEAASGPPQHLSHHPKEAISLTAPSDICLSLSLSLRSL